MARRPRPLLTFATLPDPVPRIEPIRKGGPNKPYAVLGQSYEPIAEDVPWREQGVASWYGTSSRATHPPVASCSACMA